MMKEKYTWLKHIDFILIDLLCLIFSFVISYYIRMGNLLFWDDDRWQALFILVIFTNILVMFAINPYSGILKRKYYLQIEKEVALLIFQIFVIVILFYFLKIGIIFSRQMIGVTYALYFVLSQIFKLLRKKQLTNELFKTNVEKILEIESNDKELFSLDVIEDNRNIFIVFKSIIKRLIDILAGIVGCIILIPLSIIVYLLNKFNKEDGPLFYAQDRIGKDGKLFSMLKFRTMIVDADEKLDEFLNNNPDVKKEFMIYRKIKNDPRITKVGKFLRKTSMDEWPQFISVLLGTMSLVGPRPYLPREKKQMGKYFNIIIKDKPGLTGLWQISGRSNVTFENRIELDICYHQKKSLIEDFKILLITIFNVITKKGSV